MKIENIAVFNIGTITPPPIKKEEIRRKPIRTTPCNRRSDRYRGGPGYNRSY